VPNYRHPRWSAQIESKCSATASRPTARGPRAVSGRAGESAMLGTLSTAEIEDLLRSEVIARVGCHADGRVYVVPITYAYDGEALIAHSAEGLKLRMMRANPYVCVEVDRVDNLAEWRSVIAQGRFEELWGEAASAALVQLRERFRALVVSATSQPRHALHEGESLIHRGNGGARLYRIHLFDKTGRFERP
jgi:uncharacterized protein